MDELEWDDEFIYDKPGEWKKSDEYYDAYLEEEAREWKNQTKLDVKKEPIKNEITNICPACFKEKPRGKKCPHCGYKPVYYMGIEVLSNDPM
jgi:hypothetical protein